MSQSRKGKRSRRSVSTNQINSSNKSKNNSEDVIKQIDSLRSSAKKEQKNISLSKNKNKQIFGFMVIIVIGMSGVILLGQVKTGTPPPVPPPPNNDHTIKNTIGGFLVDINASDSFVNGKVPLLYVGGQFCPFCAMERWALVMALDQFGLFNKPLPSMTSSEGKIGTYDFIGSSYSSSKVDFRPVEVKDQNNNPLEQMNQQQLNLFDSYNTNGTIPFVCIAGTTFRTHCGPSLDINKFWGKSFNDIQIQVTNKSGVLYEQIKIESGYIITLINHFLADIPTTSISTSIPNTSSD